MEWFIGICRGLASIHQRQTLHRDLKPANVFLTKRQENTKWPKIGDFGCAKVFAGATNKQTTYVGTPNYMAPELCDESPYNPASDIWSLGCILYELAALHPPFEAKSWLSLIMKIQKGEYEPLPQIYSARLVELVGKLLDKDPLRRPTAIEILELPFV